MTRTIVPTDPVERKRFEDRFWEKVDRSDTCWLWTASRSRKGRTGYGRFCVSPIMIAAHRVAWELVNGSVPDGLFVLHRCDVRHCVRVDHLFLGTNDDNMADRNSKGRQARLRGDRNGHAVLTNEQAAEILRRYRTGGITHKALAKEFGVSKATISHLLSGRHWPDLHKSTEVSL